LALPASASKPYRTVPCDEAPVKNVESDRGSFAGRLLAEALEAHAPAMPDGPCLDAETLAAWADGTLTSRERLQAEAHAAGCARCQALLAVMMTTAPPSAARKSTWPIRALGWLIPVTAAAALLVWALVPGRSTLSSSGRSLTVVVQNATADRSAAGTPAAAKPETQREPSLRASRAIVDSKAPPSALSRREVSPGEKRTAAAANDLSPAVLGGGAAELERSRVAAGPPSSPIPASTSGPVAYARSVAVGTVVVSPIPDSRWRIVPGGNVERSTDHGLTWQVQETGATLTLAGGASPSPSVCWLVGPAGTVLLSTDGRRWQRLALPETTDLISVRAADDKIASVTASDGRTFSTRDGGLTWTRSTNAR
jgi:hypothetical protein